MLLENIAPLFIENAAPDKESKVAPAKVDLYANIDYMEEKQLPAMGFAV